MEKKFALVTKYGEISDNRNVKAVRRGAMTVREAFNDEEGFRNNNSFSSKLFDTLEEAQVELAKLPTTASLLKNATYFFDCEVSYIEEREYDEDGEYELTGCEWINENEEIKD